MAIGAVKKKDGEFHCKSCSKNLVDFRGKSYSEIKTNSTPETCGIFNKSQIKPYTNYNYYKKSAFKALTILSLIGFNVSPLSANAYSSSTKEKIENLKEKEKEKSKKKKKERKKIWNPFRKKKRFPAIGCPSF